MCWALSMRWRSKVRDQLARTQREQILRTQIRVIQNELGEADEDDDDEI